MNCPICCSKSNNILFKSRESQGGREFIECDLCGLVFVESSNFLNSVEEKKRYLTHNNNPNDEGYRFFLRPVLDVVTEVVDKTAIGLDYGAGPGPALAQMFQENGFFINIYDPFFAPDKTVLDNKYGFVVSTEVVEHFYNPLAEFIKLKSLLQESGYLCIMTSMVDECGDFSKWYYHQDETHVMFYAKKTMLFLADKLDLEVSFPRRNVTLFRKII